MRQMRSGVAALALAAAACGGSSSGSPVAVTPAPAPTPTPTPSPTPAPSPTPTPTSTADLYTPTAAARPTAGVALPLGKCVNMANMLEGQPNEGSWGRAIVDADFTIIRQAGFATVRIPIWFSGHTGAASPWTIDPTYLARVRHVVDTATAAGLNVIIDYHNDDALMADPAANAPRFAAIWRQIATAFRDAPGTVWFELLNEPHDKLVAANLRSVMDPALAAVRETNATRPVIIDGQNYAGVDSLASLSLPDDPNVVPTIHTYDPFNFTHQGATFVSPSPPVGRTFPSGSDIADLNGNLAKVKAYIARTGRVPFVGEYGAIDNGAIPLDARINYYATITAAYASIGVQSCAWGYSNSFRLRDGDHWFAGMLEALRTTTTTQ